MSKHIYYHIFGTLFAMITHFPPYNDALKQGIGISDKHIISKEFGYCPQYQLSIISSPGADNGGLG